MMVRFFLAALVLPLALGFTVPKHALMHRTRSTLIVLHEIDEKAVSDAVSFHAKPAEPKYAPSPAPAVAKKQVAAPAPASVSPTSRSGDAGGAMDLLPVVAGVFFAFAAGTFFMRGNVDKDEAAEASTPAPAFYAAPAEAKAPAAVDLTLPYDAAARLAYDGWRAEFDKGAFDASKYDAFKSNYEAAAIANVVAKKNTRDAGDGDAKMISLGADADQA